MEKVIFINIFAAAILSVWNSLSQSIRHLFLLLHVFDKQLKIFSVRCYA